MGSLNLKSKVWKPRELHRVIKKFECLKKWKIYYDPKSKFKGQVNICIDKKQAIIFGWPRTSKRPKDYFLHEVLHIVMHAVIREYVLNLGLSVQENSVADICGLIDGKN